MCARVFDGADGTECILSAERHIELTFECSAPQCIFHAVASLVVQELVSCSELELPGVHCSQPTVPLPGPLRLRLTVENERYAAAAAAATTQLVRSLARSRGRWLAPSLACLLVRSLDGPSSHVTGQ